MGVSTNVKGLCLGVSGQSDRTGLGWLKGLAVLGCLSLGWVSLGTQQALSLQPAAEPLNLKALEQATATGLVWRNCRPSPPVITAETICQAELTQPSLWWAKQQFSNRLVDNWIAYPEAAPQRVDVVVNQQVWSLLDYLDRYEFVHHFGTVARDYGYNLRVFNRQGSLYASYTCEGTGGAAGGQTCQIRLDSATQRGRSRRPSSP